MATVNKQSLREEFDALKGEFARLCASGKMAADSRALFQAMLMLFEVLRVVFMEKRTPKNSTNSSKPSSQTPRDDTATTHPGANSKGTKHNAICCDNTRTVETVHASPVTQCETCGEDLSKTPCQAVFVNIVVTFFKPPVLYYRPRAMGSVRGPGSARPQ